MCHTEASHTLFNEDSLLLQIPQSFCYISPVNYCWSLNSDWLDSPFGVKSHHRLLSGQCNGYSLVSYPNLVKFIKANARRKVKWCGQDLSPQRGLEGWYALIAAWGHGLLVCFIFNKFVFIQSLVHSNANPITKGLSLYSIYDDQIVEKIQANKEGKEWERQEKISMYCHPTLENY